jgi:hypothetical protein
MKYFTFFILIGLNSFIYGQDSTTVPTACTVSISQSNNPMISIKETGIENEYVIKFSPIVNPSEIEIVSITNGSVYKESITINNGNLNISCSEITAGQYMIRAFSPTGVFFESFAVARQ